MAIRIEGVRMAGCSKRWLPVLAEKTAAVLKRRRDDAAVIFVTPAKIRRLNREYRGIDRTTDVLSFPSDAAGDLGDIFIAPSVAKKKAVSRSESYKSYLELLVVHSVLHLGGYDHHTKKDSDRMERMERKILKI